MANRNKLQKFAQMFDFPNVFQSFDWQEDFLFGKDREKYQLKGKWNELHFKNDKKITLELACGRGEYTNLLSQMYPERNFIGVDVKGARIWKGAKIALDKNLTNAAYLRTRIEFISNFFSKGEVDEIWITFPDPFLKKGKSNRRLTAIPFLKRYQEVLSPNGLVHLKTDNDPLFEFTLEQLQEFDDANIVYCNKDIYSKPLDFRELEGKTYYERMHLENGLTIKYVQFTLK